MRTVWESLPGVLLCCGLAVAGGALADALRLPVPGAILGLGLYLAWLVSGRGIGWSRPGAVLLLRWLGAMIVPALVTMSMLSLIASAMSSSWSDQFTPPGSADRPGTAPRAANDRAES